MKRSTLNHWLHILLPMLALLATGSATAKSPDQLREEFMAMMVKEHEFDPVALKRTLWQAHLRRDIIKTMDRPAEKARPWWDYRGIFVTEKRIQGGVAYWQEHQAALEMAEKEFGVPPQIVVAILGVETAYGKVQLRHAVLDALHTLGFHYPRRGKFFRSELKHFLLLAREEKMDPTQVMGSYAGAMGIPQFMPSSYRRLAYDFDKDGKRDIWANHTDVIGSIAYYLSRNGWQRGEPVAARVSAAGEQHRHFLAGKKDLPHKVGALREAALDIPTDWSDEAAASLIELEGREEMEYWVRLTNFQTILDYNPRDKYAMAVFQLSEAIKDARGGREAAAQTAAK